MKNFLSDELKVIGCSFNVLKKSIIISYRNGNEYLLLYISLVIDILFKQTNKHNEKTSTFYDNNFSRKIRQIYKLNHTYGIYLPAINHTFVFSKD